MNSAEMLDKVRKVLYEFLESKEDAGEDFDAYDLLDEIVSDIKELLIEIDDVREDK